MAAHQPGVWGIDLGQCALKAIRLEMKDGEVVATAFEYIEHPKILSQPDADPDEMTREALTQFLSRNKIRGDVVAISVPGQSGLARFVKLPPVDQKKVADIVKFEAKQQIPFPLEEVVWDYQALSTGEVVDGMALETEIGLFAIKRDMVSRAIQHFKEVNVEVHLVQMAPLSLCNFISFDLLGKDTSNAGGEEDEEHSAIVALEIGTDNSNLVITDGGKIIWQRPIPIGGNHFTRALTKELKLTFAKAEHIKRNAAKSPELKKILQALKQVLNDFVGEVQRSLGYFTNTHRNAQIKYMIGLGNAFRLPGLQKFLQEKLQLQVKKFTALERTTGEAVTTAPTFAENIMSFGVAYGLALQGLKQAKLQTNLLPYEVRLERIVRGKKPWAVVAAACLLFGLTMLHFARGMESRNASNEPLNQSKARLDAVIKEAENLKKKYVDTDGKLKATVGSLNRIGAGVRERFNWQLLHEYVNFAIPQPNGDKLVERADNGLEVKKVFWLNNPDAQKSFDLFEKKELGIMDKLSAAEALKQEKFIKENLLQINIAGINALYTEDLLPVFQRLRQGGENLMGMTRAETAQIEALVNAGAEPEKAKDLKLPKEGWVVEIRGYTYRDKADRFILATLVENLRSPTQLKDLKGQPFVLPKGLKEVVEERIGFQNLYKIGVVPNPVAGEFVIINRSWLKSLVQAGDKQKGPPLGQPQPDPVLPGQQKPSRDLWKPLGDMASSIYGDAPGVGGGFGVGFPVKGPPQGADGGKGPVITTAVPRTEFVLVFIWQEPISTQAAAAGLDKKN